MEEVTSFSTEFAVQIQRLRTQWLEQYPVAVSILRADRIDPDISGNKFFKLLPNIEAARAAGYQRILSFGGAWSNHLHALAAAGKRYGFATVGVVRGERPEPLNACLRDAAAWGMQLHFVSRADYRKKNTAASRFALFQQFGPCFIIPEGGANLCGITGCQSIISPELEDGFTHVMVPCGTGTTLCGLITSTVLQVTGIQALQGKGYIRSEVNAMLKQHGLTVRSRHWEVLDEFHGGGFAKADPELLAFISEFREETTIPLEPVYSGKLLMALRSLLASGHFPAGSRILLVHGGGLQGARGYPQLSTGSAVGSARQLKA